MKNKPIKIYCYHVREGYELSWNTFIRHEIWIVHEGSRVFSVLNDHLTKVRRLPIK